ncbi:MAG TPA: SigE family RNA polymerase sigma factor [Mycobacteriales bacterium]|nr:SigE family RNA polymerase sigma factor [Mycobacteriales bacterium]
MAGDAGTAPSLAWADADQALADLYRAHYRSLVRLAALLLDDVGTSEEVVQDAFVNMHLGWRRLRDPEKALAYLRQSVVNLSRSKMRRRQVAAKHVPAPMPDAASAEYGAISLAERAAVVEALKKLPDRQREALVLRYYGELSENEIARAMGVSNGAVKSHVHRGLAALTRHLEPFA